MEIELSSNFIKRARKLTPEEQRKLSERTEWFRHNPYDPRLKTHALTGKLKGLYAFTVTYGKRVTFVLEGKNTAIFTDVGSHNDVYH